PSLHDALPIYDALRVNLDLVAGQPDDAPDDPALRILRIGAADELAEAALAHRPQEYEVAARERRRDREGEDRILGHLPRLEDRRSEDSDDDSQSSVYAP